MADLVGDRPAGALPGIQGPQQDQRPFPVGTGARRTTQMPLGQQPGRLVLASVPVHHPGGPGMLHPHHYRHPGGLQLIGQRFDRRRRHHTQTPAGLGGRGHHRCPRAAASTTPGAAWPSHWLAQQITDDVGEHRQILLLGDGGRLRRPGTTNPRRHPRGRRGSEKAWRETQQRHQTLKIPALQDRDLGLLQASLPRRTPTPNDPSPPSPTTAAAPAPGGPVCRRPPPAPSPGPPSPHAHSQHQLMTYACPSPV